MKYKWHWKYTDIDTFKDLNKYVLMYTKEGTPHYEIKIIKQQNPHINFKEKRFQRFRH
jgi:hypothetical protein